jgi:hypothetical protein
MLNQFLLTIYLLVPYQFILVYGFPLWQVKTDVPVEFRFCFPYLTLFDLIFYFAAIKSQVANRREPYILLLTTVLPLILGLAAYFLESELLIGSALAVSPLVLAVNMCCTYYKTRLVIFNISITFGITLLFRTLVGSGSVSTDILRFRLNLPGLDVTSSSHVFCWLILANLINIQNPKKSLINNWVFFCSMCLCVFGLIVTDGRIAQIATILIALAIVLSQRWPVWVSLWICHGTLVVSFACLLCSSMGYLDDFLTDQMVDGSISGRIKAWKIGYEMVIQDPFEALLNTAEVQSQMALYRFPSHTHSAIFQIAKIIGLPAAVVLFVVIANYYSCVVGKWKYVLCALLSIQMFDFNFYHSKFIMLFFLFFVVSVRYGVDIKTVTPRIV